MIEKTKHLLKKQWGDIADSLDCYAEVKFIDPQSSWACYVYAMNPENEDEIMCLIVGRVIETCQWTLTELFREYNSHGEHPVIDTDYRRIKLRSIFKRL